MRAGSSGPGGVAAACLSVRDANEVARRLEAAMARDYPGGGRDPGLWAAVLPEDGGADPANRLGPAARAMVGRRLRAVPAEWLDPETRRWGDVFALVLPELFWPRPAPAAATPHAPGSPGKIEELARRAAAGRELFLPGDAPEAGRGGDDPEPERNFGRAGGGRAVNRTRYESMRRLEAQSRRGKRYHG